MKKSVLTIAMISLAAGGAFAQRSNIIDAKAYLRDNNYKKAITAIDAAVVNEKTSASYDAWSTRGLVYLTQAQDTVAKVPSAADESYKSYMKALSLKQDIAPAEIDNQLYVLAYVLFQKGNAAYGTGDYNTAYDRFVMAGNLYKVNEGKRFAKNKDFTTLALLAKSNAGIAAMNANGPKDNEAIMQFRELNTMNPVPDSNNYRYIIQLLERQHKDEERLATITEAEQKFPDNSTFRNLELNYYINSGKADLLLPKLEAAAAKDPSNSELWYNLGNSYAGVAAPKDAKGAPLPKPANAAEAFTKAENAYTKALAIQPENPEYNYNFGVLYYGIAVGLTVEMNSIKGMSAPEQKKYDALLARRADAFSKAQPHFEQTFRILDSKGGNNLVPDEKTTYANAMRGLLEIYSRQDNKTKTEEMRKKLDALK